MTFESFSFGEGGQISIISQHALSVFFEDVESERHGRLQVHTFII